MKFAAQIFIIAYLILSFFACVHGDFYGRKARQPGGMGGFIGTMINIAILVAVLAEAGAFSLLH